MNRLLTIEHLEAKGCRELNTFIAKAGHYQVKYIIFIDLSGTRLPTKLHLRCNFLVGLDWGVGDDLSAPGSPGHSD